MERVPFSTAVTYDGRALSWSESLLATADSYFYLGGRKAHVISNEIGAVIDDCDVSSTRDSQSFLITALKAMSYLTIVIPVGFLIAKAILRSTHSIHFADPTHPQQLFL